MPALWTESESDTRNVVSLARGSARLAVLRFTRWADRDGAILSGVRAYTLPELALRRDDEEVFRPGEILAYDGNSARGVAAD